MSLLRDRVWVIQDGARQHYIVPRAFGHMGILEGAYTDWYVKPGTLEGLLALRGGSWRTRQHPELDSSKVKSHALLTLYQRYKARKFNTGESYWHWVSQSTARWMLRRGFGNANILYGFIRNVDPSVFEFAQSKNIKTIGDQIIAPASIEMRERQTMQQRFPGWATGETSADLRRVIEIEQRTWQHANVILAGSDYVRDGLAACGVAEQKIIVTRHIPCGSGIPIYDRRGRSKLSVGCVGAINLRKGAPYLFQLASKFPGVKFIMVGPVQLSGVGLKEKPENVELIGPVLREQVRKYLEKFDIFIMPTTCEGRVGAVLEAMESGLPVITTPASGVPIAQGQEGFLTAPDDIDAMAGRLNQLLGDEDLRIEMGRRGRALIESCTMQAYCKELATAIQLCHEPE